MHAYHAVVWLDHREAKVFFFDKYKVEEIDLASHKHDQIHRRAGSISGKRTQEDHDFYHQVVETLRPAKEWLVMGPGTAKLELVKHIHKHDHTLSDHIIGVETADHPTDRQIVAHAREYFKAADKMRPQV